MSRSSAASAGVPVDADGLRPKDLLHRAHLLLEPGQPERREQPERDRLAVRELEARRRLERVRERVAEVELRPLAAIERVAQADGRLERRAPPHLLAEVELPQRLAREQAGLDDLGEPVLVLLAREGREQLGSTTTRAGQWNAPTRFFPPATSIAVLPPIAAST